MARLASRFLDTGRRVFRMDMRGCGMRPLSCNLAHAGRSDDVIRALDVIAESRAKVPSWRQESHLPLGSCCVRWDGLEKVIRVGRPGLAVYRASQHSAPLDLKRCSINMQRLMLRPYNYYFIRALLASVPLGFVNEQSSSVR